MNFSVSRRTRPRTAIRSTTSSNFVIGSWVRCLSVGRYFSFTSCFGFVNVVNQPPNASSHGYQIDHILEFCHWFMAVLFVGWSTFFIYVLLRFRKRRQPNADQDR